MSIKLEIVEDSLQAHVDYVDLCCVTPSPEQCGDIMKLLYTTIGKACDVSVEKLGKEKIYNSHDKMCFIYRVTFPHKYYNEIVDFVNNNQEMLQQRLDELV